MAVTVKKLEGDEIPAHRRGEGLTQLFRVTDENGVEHFADTDEAAAKMAVTLSEPDAEERPPRS